MAVELEGGCRVVRWNDVQPRREGDVAVRDLFRGDKLAMRVLEISRRTTLRASTDELLYILGEDVGIHLPAGATTTVDGPATIVSVRTDAATSGDAQRIRMQDAEVQRTGDRWYRELIQGDATQFVGSIPPGRAPDHFHLYEEVICILVGEGRMWAGKSSTPIGAGSCIYLPRRQPHCVENLGSGELRLLGVFYPAGSPAVRYPVENRPGGGPGEQ